MKTQHREKSVVYPKLIKGRKLKNKSLKLIENEKGIFMVISNTYLYGFRLRSRKHVFHDISEADAFYEKLAFNRFGYLA